MADFWDVVGNVATGGLLGFGQAIAKGSQAVQNATQTVSGDVQEIANEAADALDKLFRSINTSAAEIAEFLKGIYELDKLDRPDGRQDSELWPEELKRKNDLNNLLPNLESDAQSCQVTLAQDMNKLAIDAGAGVDVTQDVQALKDDLEKGAKLQAKITLVNQDIAEIIYKEPGSIPITAYYLSEAAQRLNTIEQPQIENILDTTDQDLSAAGGLIEDVRKLLWITKVVPKAALTEEEQAALGKLGQFSENYQRLYQCCAPVQQQLVKKLSLFPLPSNPPANQDSAVSEAKDSTQPQPGALNFTALTRSMNQLSFVESLQRYYLRQQEKTDSEVQAINNEEVEEPGVLTAAIDEARKCIQKFNEQEQPRIDTILDSVNQTVLETQKTMQETEASLQQARTTLGLVQGFLTNRWVKICAIVFAGLFGLILLFSMIALFRTAFKI